MDQPQDGYGEMFLDVLRIPVNQLVSGKVFTVLIEWGGGQTSETPVERRQHPIFLSTGNSVYSQLSSG